MRKIFDEMTPEKFETTAKAFLDSFKEKI